MHTKYDMSELYSAIGVADKQQIKENNDDDVIMMMMIMEIDVFFFSLPLSLNEEYRRTVEVYLV